MQNISEMLNDTSVYGFTFDLAPLGRGTGADKVMYPNQPILRVTDVALFDTHFPGVILAHSDGQSIRVHAQRVAREMVAADHGVTADAVKMAEVQSICFGRVASKSGGVKVVKMTDEQAAALVAGMVDLGIGADDALTLVKTVREM